MREAMRLVVAALVVFTAAPAMARTAAYFGDAAAMSGASGMALYRGGGSAWYNPAGLVGNKRNQVDLKASVFVLRFRDSAPFIQTTFPDGPYSADLSAVSFASIPAAMVYKRRLHPRVHLALGMWITDQDSYHLDDKRDVTTDGERYFQRISIDQLFQTYHFGVALAVKVSERVRLGWRITAVYSSYSYELRDTSAVHGAAGAGGIISDPYLWSHSVSASANLWGLQIAMGLQWHIAKGFHLGLMVRTPVIELSHKMEGEEVWGWAEHEDSGWGDGEFEREDREVLMTELVTPMQVVLGLAYKGKRFWVGLEGDITMPLRNFVEWIPYPVQWNIRAGGRVYLTDKVALGVGAFTEQSLSRDLAFIGDSVMDFYGATIGIKWRSVRTVKGRKRKDGLVFTTTIGLRYAYGIGTLQGYHVNLVDDTDAEPQVDRKVHELALFLGSSLYF